MGNGPDRWAHYRTGVLVYGAGLSAVVLSHGMLAPAMAAVRHVVFDLGLLWFLAGEHTIYRSLGWKVGFPFGAFAMIAAYDVISPIAGLVVAGLHALVVTAVLRSTFGGGGAGHNQ